MKKTMTEMAALAAGIWAHYEHACLKHPKCADDICTGEANYWKNRMEFSKSCQMWMIEKGYTCHANEVLYAEVDEICAAAQAGDFAQARYEILDAIAVLLRMDDMLQEMQEDRG